MYFSLHYHRKVNIQILLTNRTFKNTIKSVAPSRGGFRSNKHNISSDSQRKEMYCRLTPNFVTTSGHSDK